MKHCFVGSIFLMLLPYFLCAQSNEYFGARAAGMGNAAVTVSDEWSPYHNIAGISSVKKYTVGLCYKNDYAVRDFRKISLAASGPLLKGGTSVSLYRSGNEVYNTHRISFGYAHSISLVSLGLQVHYLQVRMEELGVRNNFIFELGGIMELLPSKLFFGASIFNFNQAKLREEILPVFMKAGLSYRPGKKLMVNGEVEKDLLYQPTAKAGLEYAVLKALKIRTGINTHPFLNFFGAGLNSQRLHLDYAFAFHTQLGVSHQMNLSFSLNKLK